VFPKVEGTVVVVISAAVVVMDSVAGSLADSAEGSSAGWVDAEVAVAKVEGLKHPVGSGS